MKILILLSLFTLTVSADIQKDLSQAVRKSDKEAVIKLLKAGAKPRGFKPFPILFSCKDPEIFNILVKGGADINESSSFQTLMEWHCFYGRFEIVKACIANGAKINVVSKKGSFPLLKACDGYKDGNSKPENANNELVKYLLEKGANPNLKGGGSALGAAINDDKVEIVKMLLQAKADQG